MAKSKKLQPADILVIDEEADRSGLVTDGRLFPTGFPVFQRMRFNLLGRDDQVLRKGNRAGLAGRVFLSPAGINKIIND